MTKAWRQLEWGEENPLQAFDTNDLNYVHHLYNCRIEIVDSFDDLSSIYEPFAHVPIDFYVQIEEEETTFLIFSYYEHTDKFLAVIIQ